MSAWCWKTTFLTKTCVRANRGQTVQSEPNVAKRIGVALRRRMEPRRLQNPLSQFIPIRLPIVAKPSRASRTAFLVVNNLPASQSAITRLLNRCTKAAQPSPITPTGADYRTSNLLILLVPADDPASVTTEVAIFGLMPRPTTRNEPADVRSMPVPRHHQREESCHLNS